MTKYNKFFTHDSNAKDSPSMLRLIDEMGMEGYGAYWMLMEVLRDCDGFRFPTRSVPALARRYGIDADKLDEVINGYGLFDTDDDDCIHSADLDERMEAMSRVATDRRKAGEKSGEARRNKAAGSGKGEQADGHATNKREQAANKKEEEADRNKNNNKNIKEKNIQDSSSPLLPTAPRSARKDEAAEAKARLPMPMAHEPHTGVKACGGKDMDMVMTMFNTEMEGHAIGKITCIRGQRATLTAARLKEFGMEAFATAIRKAARSSFLNGAKGKWRMDYDWMVRPNNFPKVLEGRYDDPVTTERRDTHGHGTGDEPADTGRAEREKALLRCMLSDGFGQPGGTAVRH